MIPRYTREEMASIWSDQTRYEIWLEVETLVVEKMAQSGVIPQEAFEAVRDKAKFSVDRILEIEAEVKHDVIAFLTNVAEHVGPYSRYIHRGMTSNDLLDTSFAVQLKRSGELILQGLDELRTAILNRAKEFKYTPCIGRSHGIHAEPTTFGLKLMSWYAEVSRQRDRFQEALQGVTVGKIAGAVGTYAALDPEVEDFVMDRLGLTQETVPSQIVHRDRHAAFFSVLAQIGSSVERFAVEVRHLQRTEVREAEEKFTKGQKGSSAMPHKRNPILCENVTGLARLLRGYASSAFENVALWHERDISHSSVERVIAPDACIVTDFMLKRFTNVVNGLVVYSDRMQENLDFTKGLVFSGSLLIKLVDSGMLREDAYRVVQEHALAAWEEGGASLLERISEDKLVLEHVSRDEIATVFDLKTHLKHVDMMFERTLSLHP